MEVKEQETKAQAFSKETYMFWYENMLLIRRFEEKAGQLYGQQKIRGFCHLYIGQEACATGSVSALRKGDKYITAYRDHGHPIALGTDPNVVMAELFGKATGCSKGKGGSMHIFDKEKGFVGGHGIVGGQVPLGAGLAFAEKYNKTGNLCMCYMGDGAVRQGAFHETLNLAMTWKLPVIFVIENNGYAMGTSVERTSNVTDLYKIGAAFDMPSYTFVNLFNPYLRFDKLSYSIPALEFEGDTVSVSPSTFTSSLGSELGSTNTDDLFYPSEGRIISLISELSSANVKWDVKNLQTGQAALAFDSLGFYFKLQLMVGFYFAVSRDRMTVLGIKAKSGYIGMLSGDAILVSPNQTFFAGGSNSVRGWRGRELIPSDQLLNLFPQSLNEQLKIRGGNILLEGSFEYRRKFKEDFGFVFFY